MEIASLSLGPMTARANPNTTLGSKLPDLSIDHLRAHLEELDTNSDGHLSEDEFAAYRARKQAMGQFIPLDVPVSETAQQAMFEAMIARTE